MPIAAPSAPPRRQQKTATAPGSPSVTVNKSPLYGKSKDRAEGLQGWAQIGALGCIAKGNFADAGAIAQHAEKVSEEVARAAETMPEIVGKSLDLLAMSGPYAALFGAILPLVIQLGVNHGVVPEGVPIEGVVPKAALEAQVRAEIATVQSQALMMQREAEAKLAELKAQMNGAPNA